MMNGFYIHVYGKDCFMVTNAKNKTKRLALDFINKIQNKINRFSEIDENTLKIIQNKISAAHCEIKTTKDNRQYYNIFGENFGGYGSFVDDGETIIV